MTSQPLSVCSCVVRHRLAGSLEILISFLVNGRQILLGLSTLLELLDLSEDVVSEIPCNLGI